MLKIISNNKITFPRNNLNLADFSSTILIPEKYVSLFLRKIQEHKSIHSYISFLLKKYKLSIKWSRSRIF